MRIFFILILALSGSCVAISPYASRKFSFFKGDKSKHIVIEVPKGYKDEKIKLGNEGKEQFYTYADSAILFIGLNVSWPTINQERKLLPYSDSLVSRSGIVNGVDRHGLLWKEIYFDYFVVGYSRVPASQREVFEKSVNSIRFK